MVPGKVNGSTEQGSNSYESGERNPFCQSRRLFLRFGYLCRRSGAGLVDPAPGCEPDRVLLGVQRHAPSTFVDQGVMRGANRHEVVEIGGPLSRPMLDVVGMQEALHLAARERAGVAVAMEYLTPQPTGRDLRGIADTDRV